MRIDAAVTGSDNAPAEVAAEEVEAGHVQPWMLLLSGELPDEVLVVAGDPQPFQKDDDGRTGRVERWVRIPLLDVDEPLTVPATDLLDMVYGADLDHLQDLLDPDLLTAEQEALARNGMCHRHVDDPVADTRPAPPEDEDRIIYCGRPSDPESYYRFCTECDQDWRDKSSRVVDRGFEGTYGPIPAP